MAGILRRPLTPTEGMTWGPNGYVNTEQDTAQRYPNEQPYVQGAGSAGAVSTANRTAYGDANATGVDYTIDPTGMTSYSNASEQTRKTKAQDRDSFMSLMAANPGSTAPTINGGNIQGNEQDARAAAFARAKEQAGQIARSSLTSISENLAGRNMTGGGLEALRDSGAIQGAGDSMEELNRDQLISDVNRSSDVADRNYQGAITQRGQDLSNRASYLSLLRSLY